MCGIFCSLSSTQHILPNDEIRRRLVNRGPDSINTIETAYPGSTLQTDDKSTRDVQITHCSTVLSLRSSVTVSQPYQDAEGTHSLCWNGEAWSINGVSTSGNDTKAIHKLLVDALGPSSVLGQPPIEPLASARIVSEALSHVAGPYAFVFFDHAQGRVFFGRDFLGRRSLLRRITDHGDLIISSVSDGSLDDDWAEIEADGVYCIDLRFMEAVTVWPDPKVSSGPSTRQFGQFIAAPAPYNHTEDGFPGRYISSSVIPRLSLNKDISSFSPPLHEHSQSVAKLENVVRASLHLRVSNIPDPPHLSNEQRIPSLTKLAILFSGGLDCAVLARISHDILSLDEPIDLLNVAFENPRIHKDVNSDAEDGAYELCPDRITGRASYEELGRTCPGRVWRFVAINIPYSETMSHRQDVISLMHPHNTEMDLSISLALYFAARGIGQVKTEEGGLTQYETSARVLLSGLGADELFGGYTRHTNAFRRSGVEGLLDELELDVSRLGQRNLGRDDRVMAHWSKEVRFPYLDEQLLSWALSAPVTDKCGFGEPQMDMTITEELAAKALEPGKKALRCLAWKLGMKGVAEEKKRAIQFGARTAKMETRKTKGTQLLS